MNFKKLFATVFLLSFMALPTLAANESCRLSDTVLNMMAEKEYNCQKTCNFVTNSDCGTCCLINTIYNITDWAFLIIMVVAVGMIIWGAFTYLTSSGEPNAIAAANKKILFAAIGIVVALLAKAVPGIVLSIVG
ncbi:MAG TPA: pilin [Candidatus Pacearchaeota archaeon]|nr:pilin [Candidatus Pacearchaeota archaeon]